MAASNHRLRCGYLMAVVPHVQDQAERLIRQVARYSFARPLPALLERGDVRVAFQKLNNYVNHLGTTDIRALHRYSAFRHLAQV
jgi:hypothetical protein